jgi:CRP/FNR family cyclic AMP-dependent transcriptional regulator
MITRFQGPAGRAHLVDSLLKQVIVAHNSEIAEELADAGELLVFAAGDEFVAEGAADFCLYMILMGTASIHLKGQEYLHRGVGTHIGEMTLIDISQRRSASVRAHEPMVVLKVEEADFTRIAKSFPEMWRNIAIELGSRLRQRNTLLRERNPRPRVFIGSASEGLVEANAIKAGLPGPPNLDVGIWNLNTFRPSRGTLETLAETATKCDFAILVLSADDIEISRGTQSAVPRDNVIFELGLFMGALGRERTFFVHHRAERISPMSRILGFLSGKPELAGVRIKLPSDLAGVTALTYKVGDSATLEMRLSETCQTVAEEIAKAGVR